MKNFFLLLILLFLPWICLAENADLLPVYDDTSGKWGYQDTNGQWRIPPAFDEADPFLNGYARVSVNRSEQPLNHDGIIDSSGSFILPAEYHIYIDDGDVETLSGLFGVSLVQENTLFGFFDTKSGTFSGVKWREVLTRMACDHLVPVLDENMRAGYASRTTGELVIPCLYAGVLPGKFSEGIAPNVLDEGAEDYILIDENGTLIPLPEGITAVYGSIAQNGRIVIQAKETQLYGYADLAGNVVILPRFTQADDFENGTALVEENGVSFRIDIHGNTVTNETQP